MKKNKISLKNMESGEQQEFAISTIIEELKTKLGR